MNTRNISYFFLIFSLTCFTACTTLNGEEQCALIGQIQEGTQIGTQAHISSIGSSVYSYNTRTYNPICKKPKTEEEKLAVSELYPIAKDKQQKRNSETVMTYLGVLTVGVVLGLLFIPNYYKF